MLEPVLQSYNGALYKLQSPLAADASAGVIRIFQSDFMLPVTDE